MHCPRCLTEYREGFNECADCHVPLASGPPPTDQEPEPSPLGLPRPDVELVTVAEIRDSFALRLARASLENAGIAYLIGGERPGPILGELYGSAAGGVDPLFFGLITRIRVAREDEAAARELLAPLENPEPIADWDEIPPDPIG